jgi:hypothetical protein
VRDVPAIIARALLGVACAAVVPPLGMAALWAVLSGGPSRFFAELGVAGLAGFVLSQQWFFLPVVIAGLAAHAILVCLHRHQPLLYALAFYCIGAVVYAVGAIPQLAVFALDPPVIRTLAIDALVWWGPMAGLGGLVFWLVAGRPRRGR